MNPLVSVIVPLYNYENFIRFCLKSILNQKYPNIEIIVIDDCSTDNSLFVAKKFECSNLKVIQMKKNSGYSKAKNEGIIVSQGDLITCLDADDMFTKNSIGHRVKVLDRTGADFVHANAITVNGNMTLKQCYALKKFKRQTPKVHAQTVMLKREVHKQFGLYDEALRSRSDKEMWVRLFGWGCAGPHLVRKVFSKKDVAYYRRHDQSMMKMRARKPSYNKILTKKLMKAIKMRAKGNITKENTRFLENWGE